MKKAITFLLLFVILLSAAGCTDRGKDKSTNKNETPSSTAGTTQSVPDTSTEKETSGSAVPQEQTDPPAKANASALPDTSGVESGTTNSGTDTSSSTKLTIGHSEESSSQSGTTNSDTENSDGMELPIDYFG